MRNQLGILMVLGLLLLGATAAQAQRGPGEGRGAGLGLMADNCRIVKGSVEKITDDYVTISVDEILVPREGPLSDKPDSVRVSFGEDCRFVTEKGRESEASDFSKGDAVVAITTFEDGKYALRALVSAEVAAAMRKQIGERIRDRRGERERGMPGRSDRGQGQQGLMERQRAHLLVGVFEGVGEDGVEMTLKGILKPSPTGAPEVEPFPEEKTVTVSIGERTRYFHDGEKASVTDFAPGEDIVAMIIRPGPEGSAEGPVLMLLADKESAEKLRELVRGMADRRQDRQRRRDGSRTS